MSSPKLFNLPDPSQREALTKFFRDRQVGRLRLVGCEDDKLWQYVMHQVVGALDAHLRDDNAFRFLLGPRPTAADFALYGLLKQLSLDHTTGYIIRDRFTAVYGWIMAMDDSSGLEVDAEWELLRMNTPAVRKILKLVTSMYLPYLVANSRASRGDEVRVEFRLDDGQTFLHREKFGSYQKKCFENLRRQYVELNAAQRREISKLAGCQLDQWLDVNQS
ncbi:conserved hypothetical protein, partial [Perkinsus marinus ATCC 50983]